MSNELSNTTRLRELFPGADYYPAGCDPRYAGVGSDPHAIEPGDVFVHLDEFDSSDAELAVARGAAAVVAERLLPIHDAPQAIVEDSRVALRKLRAAAAGPNQSIEQIVMVGSLGSERAATQLAAILSGRGEPVGLFTQSCDDDGEHCLRRDASRPEAAALWLERCELGGVKTVIAEATPDTPIERAASVVCVTSLRCDGLNTHGLRQWPALATHRAALRASAGLVGFGGLLVVNADDPDALHLAARHTGRLVVFGESDAADVRVTSVDQSRGEQTFLVACGADSACVTIPCSGRASRRDAAAAIATAVACGVDLHVAASSLSLGAGTPARLRAVVAGQPYSVCTDAAMRPLELAEALEGAGTPPGRLIAVVRLSGRQLGRTRADHDRRSLGGPGVRTRRTRGGGGRHTRQRDALRGPVGRDGGRHRPRGVGRRRARRGSG